MILRGMYDPIDKSMTVAGVYVNNAGSPIKALRGKMSMKIKDNDAAVFPKMDFQFNPDFLGEINHNEGFIVHVKIPVKNLQSEKRIFGATELTGSIDEIQVIH